LLDDLVALFEEYVHFKRQHYARAAALWCLHIHVYDQFSHTPRFGAFSHDPQSGKSVLITYLLGELSYEPRKLVADAGIAASLFAMIDADRPTILLDEAQNTEVAGTVKSIINGGFDRSAGGIPRRVMGSGGGTVRQYMLFAPFAFAWNLGSTDATLKLDTLSRCIVLDFDKGPRRRRYDPNNEEQQAQFATMRQRIFQFVTSTTTLFNTDPDIPAKIDGGRYADCWRPLLSIADALGRGDSARQTALAMADRRMDESPRLRLLRDIRAVFYNEQVKTIVPERLVDALHDLEETSLEDGESWALWKGVNRTSAAHALTAQEMYAMLHTFRIVVDDATTLTLNTKTVRLSPGQSVARGYSREQFMPFWERFCPDA
jgi:hypothetical protein